VEKVCSPADEKCKRFAKEQEAARKDVRTFSLLQSKWAIVRYPVRTWSSKRMWNMNMISACVIMHNMIVEAKHDDNIYNKDWNFQDELVDPYPEVAS
jgi:hypothetical protein